jgi:flavoprotein
MAREAKTKLRMCRRCSGDLVDQFKALIEGKENIVFEEKCVGGGKCGTATPFLKFEKGKDKKILEAATVEELLAQIG